MKSNILTVMKKEFARFFSDKRVVVSTLILPGLLIYLMYTLMGSVVTDMVHADETKAKAYTVNLPASAQAVGEGLGFEFLDTVGEETESIKEMIKNKEADVLVVFPKDFDQRVADYDIAAANEKAPNIEIYYNSINASSSEAYYMLTEALNAYENTIANKFDVNAGEDVPEASGEQSKYDLSTEQDASAQVFSMMMPMLLMIFMFTACMGIAPESIAGEKERGTMATMLVTPVKRGELAVGKILSLGVLALLSGVSSFVGIVLSLPNLMGGTDMGVDATAYNMADYGFLVMIIMCTVLLIISLISLISAFAKSVKEAATAVMPLMIIVMLISVFSMMSDNSQVTTALYFIPLYNSVLCMSDIFSFNLEPVNVLITFASNLVYTAIAAWGLTKMFNSEKIIFSK